MLGAPAVSDLCQRRKRGNANTHDGIGDYVTIGHTSFSGELPEAMRAASKHQG
jgi:hypothetical protein